MQRGTRNDKLGLGLPRLLAQHRNCVPFVFQLQHGLSPSTTEATAREGHSCQGGYNAYLITLTRSWKALSTLRGGSLALVSIYGIWKAKLILAP